MTEYEQAFDKLNAVQRTAVAWQENAALILAGPGSGKTTVLTTRIARLLNEAPDQKFRILALTFTNKAADEMTARLTKLIPGEEGRLLIGTFHAFCSHVLRQHGSHIGIPPDFTIYSLEEDRRSVLREAIKIVGKTALQDNDKAILERIDKLKSWFVTPETTPQRFRDPEQGARFAAVYRAYEDELQRLNALDFHSLLLQTHRLFTTFPAIAERYQRTYPYWLIDEFQDTNAAQYRLIKTMAGTTFKNILVVADDDQIIYEWNGASYQQLARFRTDFAPELIQLPTNYRCPATIVAAANRLVTNNNTRTPDKTPLIAAKTITHYPAHEHIRLLPHASDVEESRVVAATIAATDPTTWGETMVLARNRSLLERLLPHLKQAGVPAVIAQRRDQFLTPQYRWLQCCLKQIVRPQDQNNFAQLISAYNRLAPVTFSSKDLLDDAQHNGTDGLTEWTTALAASGTDALQATAAAIVALREHPDRFRTVVKTIEQAFHKNAPDDEDLAEDRAAWQELAVNIAQSVGRDASLDHFLQQLDLRSKEPTPPPDTVRLMTIHAAKGTEADQVYVIGMAEDYIPSFQSIKKGDNSAEMEEERRSCFVAITRTKEQLTLSSAKIYQGYTKKPSRFLAELGLTTPTK
jgi:DNA helicase-2/ATP-dependent DNA helicase PcrA